VRLKPQPNPRGQPLFNQELMAENLIVPSEKWPDTSKSGKFFLPTETEHLPSGD
jgi:hypothetical protein